MPLIGATLVALATIYATWTASRRLVKEFEHDHEVRRREHVRSAIDDCSLAYEEAYISLGHFRQALDDDDGPAIAHTHTEARAAIERVNIQRGRLELRLRSDAPLVVSFKAVEDAVHLQYIRLDDLLSAGRPVSHQEILTAADAYGDVGLFMAFRAVAYELVWAPSTTRRS